MNNELRTLKIFKIKLVFTLSIILYSLFLIHDSQFLIPASAAEVPENLKSAIEQKTKELETINQQISEAQKKLDETEGKGKTLKKEITQADQKISQLNLGIKASEINISKLKLEVESLQYNLKDIHGSMEKTRAGIAKLFRELVKRDREPLIITFLRGDSLADSINELANVASLNLGLSEKTTELQLLDTQVAKNIDVTAQKKQQVEKENSNLKNKKGIAASQKSEKQNLLEITKNQEKNYQNLLSELEKQQNSISDEISKIEDQLRASFDPDLLPSKRPGVFAWPIQLKKYGGLAYITQHFGEKSYLYRGKAHNGLDIGSPLGTPILAADDGIVVAVDNNDQSVWNKYQYGKYVLIDHKNNLSTLYAHLSRQNVNKGDAVKRGDVIGYLGNTGYATGPHLHFGAYWTPSILMKVLPPAKGLVPVGVIIDPEDYL